MTDDATLLRHVYDDQRWELAHCRSRAGDVFTWSSTILVTITGGLLVVPLAGDSIIVKQPGVARWFGLLLVTGLVVFSIVWQSKQNRLARAHQRVLVEVAKRMGCFAPTGGEKALFPDAWLQWGTRNHLVEPTRIHATLLLGLAAAAAVWLVSAQAPQTRIPPAGNTSQGAPR